MATPANIIDSRTGNEARVTPFGQLIVAPISYSSPVLRELLTPGESANFIEPAQDQIIVITDIIASADKDVSNTTPADITIYSTDSVDSTTPVDIIVRPQLIRSGNFPLTGLNLKIPEGLWVNATTTDGGILLTIMFYRAPVERFAND
ncbi:MAG: hypothetical protein KUG81_10360 [Gammaproteobacteria bacterium]|nr:hypothetical protein [Gammaproteobacteria bacterium]